MSDVLSIPAVSNFTTLSFESRFNQALIDMRRGHPVVLVDDFDRENEADLIVAAERISVPTMAMLIRECSGIVCLCLTDKVADRLDLPMMVSHSESRFQTAFTVTIDAREGITTGVSAQERAPSIWRSWPDSGQRQCCASLQTRMARWRKESRFVNSPTAITWPCSASMNLSSSVSAVAAPAVSAKRRALTGSDRLCHKAA